MIERKTTRKRRNVGKTIALVLLAVVTVIGAVSALVDDGQGMDSYVCDLLALPLLLAICVFMVYGIGVRGVIESVRGVRKARKAITDAEALAADNSISIKRRERAVKRIDRERKTTRESAWDVLLSIVTIPVLTAISLLMLWQSAMAVLDIPAAITGDYESTVIETPILEHRSSRKSSYYGLRDGSNSKSQKFEIDRKTYEEIGSCDGCIAVVKYLPWSHETMSVTLR